MNDRRRAGDHTVGIKSVEGWDEETHLVPVVVVGLAVGLCVRHGRNGSCRAVIHTLSLGIGFLRAA